MRQANSEVRDVSHRLSVFLSQNHADHVLILALWFEERDGLLLCIPEGLGIDLVSFIFEKTHVSEFRLCSDIRISDFGSVVFHFFWHLF